MKLEELRQQHAVARDRVKLAFYHADSMYHSVDEISRSEQLCRELERALTEANKLSKMVTEYNAIKKN